MTKIDNKSNAASGKKNATAKTKLPSVSSSKAKTSNKIDAPNGSSAHKASKAKKNAAAELKPIIVRHEPIVPEGLPKKYFLKSTFNTHDIMHAPVEKTIKMLDKILAGERLFTM